MSGCLKEKSIKTAQSNRILKWLSDGMQVLGLAWSHKVLPDMNMTTSYDPNILTQTQTQTHRHTDTHTHTLAHAHWWWFEAFEFREKHGTSNLGADAKCWRTRSMIWGCNCPLWPSLKRIVIHACYSSRYVYNTISTRLFVDHSLLEGGMPPCSIVKNEVQTRTHTHSW